jgi:hypothetical protein
MKAIGFIFLAALLIVTGCSTYRGGTNDQYEYQNATQGPIPGNGTVRPGMNPADIRDPASVSRPLEPRPTFP